MRYLLVLFSSALLIGCGSEQQSAVPVFPVTGKVTFNGQPVVGANVTFFNQEKSRSAFGKTNDAGEYSLTTFNIKDGAVDGNHVVTISKFIAAAEPVVEASIESEEYEPPKLGYEPPVVKPESGLPENYSDPAASGITAKVSPDGDNVFNFDL